MKVLLIWEEIPENTRFFLLDNPTEKELEMLEMANNKIINVDDECEALDYLNAALTPEKYKDDKDLLTIYKDTPEIIACWAEKEVSTPINGPIDKVYLSGFYM